MDRHCYLRSNPWWASGLVYSYSIWMNADAEQSDGPEWIIIFIFDPTIIMMGLFACGPVLVLYGPSGLQKNLKEGCILGGSWGRPAEKKNMGCKWAKTWKWYKFGRNICRSSHIFWKIAKLKVKLWAKSLEISSTNSISFERYENGNLQGANTIHEKDNHHQSLPFPICCTLHAVDCIIMVLVDELKRSQDWSPA